MATTQLSHPLPPSQDEEIPNKKPRPAARSWLRDHRVLELVRDKRRLVEVPYTATLAHTVNALVANGVIAVPVAAPPGHWIGAGGSMILESDRATGVVRKHYIGMVTMLDVLAHIAEEGGEAHGVPEHVAPTSALLDMDEKMSVPVSSIIGHSLEGLSLWTLNPNTSILDSIEIFSKGVHRALVPLESHTDPVLGVELVEASPGYRMLSQMDLLSFLKAHDDELKDIISCSVMDLGAINENVFAVTKNTKVIEAIKSMREFCLTAIPIVEAFEGPEDGETLQDGKGRNLIGTFSATDLRGCPVALLQSWLSISVMEYLDRVAERAGFGSTTATDANAKPRKMVTCYHESSLAQVIDDALASHVHRVWVVDRQGLLRGLISLTDMLKVVIESALRADQEMDEAVTHEQSG